MSPKAPIALLLLLAASACSPDAESYVAGRAPGYFTVSSSAFEIGPITALVPETDDVVGLFRTGDVERTSQGYLITDSGNNRLVAVDHRLNFVGATGREGDGPGEYQFANRLAAAGDRVAVLDEGLLRVSLVEPDGALAQSTALHASAGDVAWHAELGLVIADAGSTDHYLSRFQDDRQVAFARIPPAFHTHGDAFRIRTDLVAVTSDGTIHVLDGSHLALASYAPDGTLLRATFLPEPARSEALQRSAADVKSFGGPQAVLGAWLATSLQPLANGRLFVDINMGDAMGYVLDPATTEATPVVFPAGHDGRAWGASAYFEGDQILFYGSFRGPQLALATLKLVSDPAIGGVTLPRQGEPGRRLRPRLATRNHASLERSVR